MKQKLQFAFRYEASQTDNKTSVIAITSITTEDSKKYVLLEADRYVSRHLALTKTEAYKRVKKSLSQRGQERTIWITCTEEMLQTYFDEDDNLMFNDLYLKEIKETDVVETTQKSESQLNLKNISERFMIEKFVCKFSNAKQWIETFENECVRFEINKDTTKIEILRLFLDKSCTDWHSATLKSLKIEAGWSEWKNKFLDSFADKGWSTGMYAIFYKYKEGSLMEYAIRKEKLLLDMDENIGTKSLVTLIAAGLPEFIRNRIDPEKCETSTRLLHEINKCENLVNNKSLFKKREQKDDNRKYIEGKKPCKNCQNLNKGTRFHPEQSCWFKKEGKENKMIGSNSVLEVSLSEETKNE
ncbi:uncharacterized protein LOC121739592 [Aricia agestis]|uniref:uncharacterized protein LOC121739592 n=1 Tax=Aricia agestis TaxID=91739 RepID=UPI001C203D27|nr:uncharacterized protein LOC121739592 [Aricia agestis]